ncbi:MAG: Fic family protein [Deltaproteobacteria bacterium]|nr:Fic family protein [Deltaproteobacteria bacterium]
MHTRLIEIDELTEDLRDALDMAPLEVREAFHRNFDYSWIHHENALEGVVLTYPEIHGARTQSVITDLANFTLYKKIRANFEALEMVRRESESKRFRFTISLFQTFYENLYLGMDRDKGKYRRDIPLHRTYFHEILAPEKIADHLNKLVQDVTKSDFKNLHPLEQAAYFGYHFMRVFPWSEASGMVGRLMSNILLMRASYFPVVIHEQDREQYYGCLKANSWIPLRDMLAESMQNSLTNSLEMLRSIEEARAEQAG